MDGIRKEESLGRWDKSVYSEIKWKSFQYVFGIHVNRLVFTRQQSKQNNCKRVSEREDHAKKRCCSCS